MEITLYALANYNHGRLISKTFTLADYRDHDDYREAVSVWLNTVPYPCEQGRFEEEWIVADYEDIPEQFVDEYDLYREFWAYLDLRRDISSDQLEAFDVFYDLFVSGDDNDLPEFGDKYIGHFEHESDFVYYWFTEVKGFSEFPPSELVIDYEDTKNVILANNALCEEGGHYFNNC